MITLSVQAIVSGAGIPVIYRANGRKQAGAVVARINGAGVGVIANKRDVDALRVLCRADVVRARVSVIQLANGLKGACPPNASIIRAEVAVIANHRVVDAYAIKAVVNCTGVQIIN